MNLTGLLGMQITKTVAYLTTVLLLCSLLYMPCVASPMEQIMASRQSIRSYTNEAISNQLLLEVLWAAYGQINGRWNVPEIGNDYSLIIFAVNSTACYRYVPESNSLVVHDLSVNKETIRPHDGSWPSDAQVVLIVVWDQTKMDNAYFASADAGCCAQNVYLAAASLNLGTCCVGSIASEGLRSDLNLASTMIPLLVMPLGYPTSPYPPASPNYAFMTGNLPSVKYSETAFEDAIRNMLFTQVWSTESLSSQEISQLLWAAYGYTNLTSSTSYHRTTPSANGIYPLIIYISNATGVYSYLPENHSVSELLLGDKRLDIANACSSQLWAADAPAIFLIVYNSSLNNGGTADGGILSHEFIEVDAGAVIQQLFLEASTWNLSANILGNGLEDWDGNGAADLRSILNLPSSLIPLYIVPIGARVADTLPPTIGVPTQNPETSAVEPNQNVIVTVNIVDENTGIREVILSYNVNENQWTNITMSNSGKNTYVGAIPGFEANSNVHYKIIACDQAGNVAVQDKNGAYYVYQVIPEFPSFSVLLIPIVTLVIVFVLKRLQINRGTTPNSSENKSSCTLRKTNSALRFNSGSNKI